MRRTSFIALDVPVGEGRKIIGRARRLGVFVRQTTCDDGLRRELIDKLPSDEGVRDDVESLSEKYDLAVKRTRPMKRRLIELTKMSR